MQSKTAVRGRKNEFWYKRLMNLPTTNEPHDDVQDERTARTFSIRRLLRDRRALLVHFNTPQSLHPTGFPEDLRNAKSLKGKHLAFCTIRVYDRGPHQVAHFEDANAGGDVGLVVDIQDKGSVIRVCPDDGGTDRLGEGFGEPPSEAACVKSIDQRNSDEPHGNNEWRVQDYTPLGIFVFLPACVFTRTAGDRPITLSEVLTDFPEDRILSCADGSFQEYDRASGQWIPVVYDEIVPR